MKMLRYVLATMLALGPAVVEAGTITLNFGAAQTITTNARQDAQLNRLRLKTNQDRQNQAPNPLPPFATVELMLVDILNGAINSFDRQANEIRSGDACSRWRALPPAQRDAAIAGAPWNGDSPCGP